MIPWLSLLAFVGLTPVVTARQNPDFSGTWTLDASKSDDARREVLASWGDPNRMKPKDRQVADRLLLLATALDRFEIRQTPREISLYYRDDVRIYYIDGKKHTRETPWGEKLETVTDWEGSELHLKTDGKDLGDLDEIYAFDGDQMLYTVRLKVKHAKEEIVIRNYFDRVEE
jgi:hypothetical protein